MATLHQADSKLKLKRIDLRISNKVKEFLTSAAHLTGKTVSAFLLESAYEKAKQVIDEQESLYLSHQEREQFLALIENPPKPAPRLVKAMQHYLASR